MRVTALRARAIGSVAYGITLPAESMTILETR